MNIGIFGGTFDPPHMGHIRLAEKAVQSCNLQRLILLPSAVPPHKKSDTSPYHRYNMAKLVAENYGYEISDMEYQKITPSYTVETIENFQKLYPCDNLFFIIGGDSMLDFEKWYKWDKLINMCTFIVGTRKKQEAKKVKEFAEKKKLENNAKIIVLDFDPVEISSTQIRQNEDFENIPDCIKDYIKENSLY
ncbi:MAG: nicotinate (nicotinamide) nucleotide adenylyltransferase [Clostridia bacterium]|nr:nicotinate (nicotinamide) nucleotide adenylyltransferase [Clostridia bacterium]